MARSRRSGGEAVEGGEARAAAPAELSFEGALTELEGVVSQLESGDMPLEQALEAFESGVKLSRRCAATLEAAERRIEILMAGRPGSAVRVEPFGAPLLDSALLDSESDTAEIDTGDDDPDGEMRES